MQVLLGKFTINTNMWQMLNGLLQLNYIVHVQLVCLFVLSTETKAASVCITALTGLKDGHVLVGGARGLPVANKIPFQTTFFLSMLIVKDFDKF